MVVCQVQPAPLDGLVTGISLSSASAEPCAFAILFLSAIQMGFVLLRERIRT